MDRLDFSIANTVVASYIEPDYTDRDSLGKRHLPLRPIRNSRSFLLFRMSSKRTDYGQIIRQNFCQC